jgi:hypothetical protein
LGGTIAEYKVLVKLTIGEAQGRIGEGDKSENKENRVKEGEKVTDREVETDL